MVESLTVNQEVASSNLAMGVCIRGVMVVHRTFNTKGEGLSLFKWYGKNNGKERIIMEYPTIDLLATGKRINMLRKERKISVGKMKEYLGFNNATSIYRWLRGESLPTLENMYAISLLFETCINEIIVKK